MEIVLPNYSWFHLQDFVNWRHQLFPLQSDIAACRIFQSMFLISLNATPFFMRIILCSSASIALCLPRASSMHRVATSTIQPITYFLTAHWYSPDSKLFLYIGFFPLFPDTCGGGKMLWIPCRNALDKLSSCAGSLVYAMWVKSSQNTSSMVQNSFSSSRVKNLSHLFVPQMLALSMPGISDIVFPYNGCSGSVPARS